MNPYNSLIIDVDVTLDASSRVYVEYANPRAGRFRTTTTESLDTHREISLVRLRPLTTYSYDVFVVDDQGRASKEWTGSFRAGPLPPGLNNAVAIVQGQPTYPLTLKEHNDDNFQGMVVLDSKGYIVWYFESTQGPPTAIAQKPNGNLLYILNLLGLREITPLGEEVGRLDEKCISPPDQGRIHHEVFLMPENRVLYLSSEIHDAVLEGEVRPQTSDSIWVWDQNSGAARKLFEIFDFIPVDDRTIDSDLAASDVPEVFFWTGCRGVEGVQDWTHSNSLFVTDRGNVVLSMRHLDQIVSIAPDFQSIEWRLGGPGGDFKFQDAGDRFYHQHSAVELPNGNILLFDNGNLRPEEEGGEYSRALELKLDFQNMTATKVWEYRYDPDFYAACCSNVTRLPDGNTLVLFGADFGTDICCRVYRVVEADPSGRKVFEMQLSSPGAPTQYRVYPMFSIYGEIQLSGPAK